jgi:hypothetical protein
VTSKLVLLRVDERGADVYLAAVFSIIDLLTKTLIRDAANNAIMEPVPLVHSPRPPLPNMPRTSLQTRPLNNSGHYNTQTKKSKTTAPPTTTSRTRSSSHWRHLASRTTPVSPTSTNKLTTPLAPGQTCAKIFNHASKIQRGEPHGTHHPSRAGHATTTLIGPPLSARPTRLTRTATPAKNKNNCNAAYRDYKRNRDDDRRNQPYPQDDCSASPATTPPTPINKYPCANCNADHRTIDRDSTKCGLCEATFPTASQRKAHYHSYHRTEQSSKRTRFNLPAGNPSRPSTPPTGPFLNRSARSIEGGLGIESKAI